RLPAVIAPRPHDRGVRGGLHVDDRHPAQLGRELSRERLLSPLRAPRRERAALRPGVAARDGAAHRDLRGGVLAHRVERARLESRPGAARAPDVRPSTDGLANLLDWVAACVLVSGALFGAGKLLLHETLPGILMLGVGAIGGVVIYRDLSRRGWRSVVE